MADYDFRPGGSLKLKGKGGDGGVKKKKKSTKDRVKDQVLKGEERSESPKAAGESGSNTDDTRTEAQRRFEETQRKRLERKVAKMAKTTHKDRVHEFNSKLEALSEHHDIPKVGPG